MNGAQKQREIFRRAEVVRQEVKKLRNTDPTLSNVAAWRRLVSQKPHLFEDLPGESKDSGGITKYVLSGDGARREAPSINAAVREGMQLIRAQLARDIRQTVNEVQQAQPDLSFADAWQLAKKENPSLFAGAARIEARDWSSGTEKPPRYVDTGPKKVAARTPKDDDDREVYVVMAGNEVVDIELV